ncbi:MAG: amino acid ABC transporter ATP-binding protein, partial [Rhizobiaceae bacterium]
MITFEDVHKSFGDHEILKGIDAKIGKGQVVCLIGPSGSGKSTLLRCVNGLENYQRGSIIVDGVLVDAASPKIHTICSR